MNWRGVAATGIAVALLFWMVVFSFVLFATAQFGGRLTDWGDPQDWILWLSISAPAQVLGALMLWESGLITKRATTAAGVRRLIFVFAAAQPAWLIPFTALDYWT